MTITYYENVGLSNKYEHCLNFPTQTLKTAFFNSKAIAGLSDIPVRPFKISNGFFVADVNYDTVQEYNYISITNSTRTYYAFVEKVEYITASTVRIFFSVDIMTTYEYDYTLKECFVQREHEDRWNINDTDLEPIFNLNEENLAYGKEYKKSTTNLSIGDASVNWLYISCTEKIDVNALPFTCRDYGGKIDIGLHIYCVPYNTAAAVNGVHVYKNSVSTYIKMGDIQPIVNALRENVNVITMHISKIPPVEFTGVQSGSDFNIDIDTADLYWTFEDLSALTGGTDQVLKIRERKSAGISGARIIYDLSSFYITNDISISNDRNEKYESKLLTYPYAFTSVNYGTNTIILKNEFLTEDTTLQCFQSLSSENSSLMFLKDYVTASTTTTTSATTNSENIITNQIPNYLNLRTDAWNNYISSNRASRTSGYITAGVTTGLAVTGALLAPVTAGASLAIAGISVGAGTKIAGQITKEADIKNTPDDLKQFNGDLSLAQVTNNLFARKTRYELLDNFKERLFNYLTLYGYKTDDIKIPNYTSRYYFNYIKTINSYVDTNLLERHGIEEIFNRGTTFWHYRDATTFRGISDYTKENVEMTLIAEEE